MLCELPGLGELDGTLLCPGRNDGTSNTTDPVVEATLSRRLDCLVGWVQLGRSGFGVEPLEVAFSKC